MLGLGHHLAPVDLRLWPPRCRPRASIADHVGHQRRIAQVTDTAGSQVEDRRSAVAISSTNRGRARAVMIRSASTRSCASDGVVRPGRASSDGQDEIGGAEVSWARQFGVTDEQGHGTPGHLPCPGQLPRPCPRSSRSRVRNLAVGLFGDHQYVISHDLGPLSSAARPRSRTSSTDAVGNIVGGITRRASRRGRSARGGTCGLHGDMPLPTPQARLDVLRLGQPPFLLGLADLAYRGVAGLGRGPPEHRCTAGSRDVELAHHASR